MVQFIAAAASFIARANANALASFGAIPFSVASLTKPKSADRGFAARLQLVSTGTSNLAMDGKCAVGSYALVSGQATTDLGNNLTVIPLAVIDKAVDFSDQDDIKSSYDPSSDEFKRIAKTTDTEGFGCGCMYGPTFLLFETSTCQFVELFLNNKSSRIEAPNLAAFLPISLEAAKQFEVEARAPQPVSLTSKKIVGKGKQKNQWFVPVSEAFDGKLVVATPPSPEELTKACKDFFKQAEPKIEESRAR